MKNKLFTKKPLMKSAMWVKGCLIFIMNAVTLFLIRGKCLALDCGDGFEDPYGVGVCIPIDTGLPEDEVYVIITNFLYWLLIIFGILAVIAFVISGIQYLVSAGDQDMLETAKRNTKWSLIGVIIGLSGLIIINAIDAALNGWEYF